MITNEKTKIIKERLSEKLILFYLNRLITAVVHLLLKIFIFIQMEIGFRYYQIHPNELI